MKAARRARCAAAARCSRICSGCRDSCWRWCVIFGLQTVDRSFGPVLPLYVAQVGVAGQPHSDRDRRAVFARRDLGGVRPSPRRPLDESPPARSGDRRRHAARAAAAVAAIVIAPSLWFVGAAMLLFGVSVGVATTTIYAVAGIVAAAGRARDRLRHHDDGVAAGIGGEPGGRRLHRRIRTAAGVCRGRVPAGNRWNPDLVSTAERNPWNTWNPWNPWNPSLVSSTSSCVSPCGTGASTCLRARRRSASAAARAATAAFSNAVGASSPCDRLEQPEHRRRDQRRDDRGQRTAGAD